ncbi:MAG: hypothetical protein H0X25_15200 [Acidobacteriales bacterium]|nr:hypothetical protein [Terriglobales bacterium]
MLKKKAHPPATHSPMPWQSWRVRVEAVLGVFALLPIVLFLVASLGRLRYPFPLEQLEGSMLLAAERIANGLPVYARPDFHFIPYMYAPAYYYVSGWAVRLLGPGFMALRLVSLLSLCGSLVLIYCLVLLDAHGSPKRRHLAGLVAAGLYAVAYPWTHAWFDLGRVDSLYILLLLFALLCTRLSQKSLHPIFAAAAWTLAFLAKQTIFPVAIILLCCDWQRPRRMVAGLGSFLVMTAISVTLLNHVTQGWFWFYAFTVPHANTDLLLRPATFFISSQLIAPFGMALLVIAAAWFYLFRAKVRVIPNDQTARLYFFSGISTFLLCWFLQAHAGATANTPMPVYAVLAIIFGIAFGRLDAALALENSREWARILLLAATAIPLISSIYNPRDLIPHHPILSANQQLVDWMRSFSGDVFVPVNPYQAVVAGKQWHPDVAALHDALRADLPEIRQPILNEIQAQIDGEQFDAIALDGLPAQALASQPWLPKDLESHYPLVGLVPGGDASDPFEPSPNYFLLPCREQGLAAAKGWTLLRVEGVSPCKN